MLETVNHKSSTDNCREDSQGDGNNRGDPPGYNIYNSVGLLVVGGGARGIQILSYIGPTVLNILNLIKFNFKREII